MDFARRLPLLVFKLYLRSPLLLFQLPRLLLQFPLLFFELRLHYPTRP